MDFEHMLLEAVRPGVTLRTQRAIVVLLAPVVRLYVSSKIFGPPEGLVALWAGVTP